MDFFLFDITGGVFEYQIIEPMGPNSTHSKACSAARLLSRLRSWGVMCFLAVLPNDSSSAVGHAASPKQEPN